MVKIKRALISVSDKTGILDLARELNELGVEILSTGGTAKLLRQNNIAVKEVSDYTGFPEMLDGRVKTLHPKIHGGLLALRENNQHMQTVKDHGIGLIDMVVVNLYPFEKAIQKSGITLEEAIENIDIGGPSMLRSAAKNHRSVAVICNPDKYGLVIDELRKNNGSISRELMRDLGVEVFKRTHEYDAAIYDYLSGIFKIKNQGYPKDLHLVFNKVQDLRYGENPHQRGALYRDARETNGIANLKQLQGKELSFNNILDLHNAWELIKEFDQPAAVIVKHNNPCGVAEAKTLDKAYKDAWACDKLSAFGGVVGLNRTVDLKTGEIIFASGFLECIIAPGFSPQALSLFAQKKNLRILELKDLSKKPDFDFKKVSAGLLLQDKDNATLVQENLKIVTKKKPTPKQLNSLIFAWKVAKHTKSNAIVLAKDTKTVGIGAGQMSRVESVIIAKRKAATRAINSCLASDGFFPKPDAIIQAKSCKVKAIIQPGGSIADKEIIQTCDKHNIAMVFTGIRHFKH